jgi:hypothetical protein
LSKVLVGSSTTPYKFAVSVHDDVNAYEQSVFEARVIYPVEILPQLGIDLLQQIRDYSNFHILNGTTEFNNNELRWDATSVK